MGHPQSRTMEDVEEEQRELLKRLSTAALLFEDFLFQEDKRKRKGNEARDRARVERTVDSWTEQMFFRQFRMTRKSFAKLRDIVDAEFP